MGVGRKAASYAGGHEKSPRAAGHPVIALAGNPNTGKSTLFNALTGLKQHTGNWPGKTVLLAQGVARHRGRAYTIVDLPGTYSLLASSVEEQAASDFLCLERPDVTVVVVDATSLERNLNLALQVLEVTDQVVICVNLLDEAERKGYAVDTRALEAVLGVPAVGTVARSGRGVAQVLDAVEGLLDGRIITNPNTVTYDPDIEDALRRLELRLAEKLPAGTATRWLAVRALCGDESVRRLAGVAPEPVAQPPVSAARQAAGEIAAPPEPVRPAVPAGTNVATGKGVSS